MAGSSIQLFDTHCHIHESEQTDGQDKATQERWAKLGNPSMSQLVADATEAGVTRLLCVGCATEDSERAVAAVQDYEGAWATIGIHPHEAQRHLDEPALLSRLATLVHQPKVVAVGECGLDFYYENSPRDAQEKILRFQMELAQKNSLPMIFHVRDAFDEFWPIFDDYPDVKGVVHSFSSTPKDLVNILHRGLYVGLNGIMTFTKDPEQLEAAKVLPLERMLLETDAPFLTPHPQRGTICEPKHVRVTAEFLAKLRSESLERLAEVTTRNAHMLFDI